MSGTHAPPMDKDTAIRALAFDSNLEHQIDDKDKASLEQVEHPDNTPLHGMQPFESLTLEETLAAQKKLVRKFDFRILPILVLLFILNILDRGNVANAHSSGMDADLGMTGDLDYNNLVLILFVGYVITQVPVGLILSKCRPALFLSSAVFLWGAVSMCCGFARNYAQIMVIRFLVGVFAAPFFPGALLILSSFYTKTEVSTRIAIMYCGNSISNGSGGLLAAGITKDLDGVGGYEGWRWLFIIEGVITCGVAVACYFMLPSWPSNTPWLSEEERRLAVWRAQCDAMGQSDEGGEESLWQGAKLVLTDWRVFAIVLQQNLISCAQSFTYFFPAIVKSLGYGRYETLLLTAPPYFFAFILSIVAAVSSTKFNEKAYHIAVPMLVGAIGNIMAITLPFSNVAGRYVSMFMLTLSSYCAFNLSYAWLMATVPRPRIKRAASLSLVSGLANASHFYTPYIFPKSDSPRFLAGGIALAVFNIGVAGVALSLKFAFKSQNRKLQRLDDEGKAYPGSLKSLPKGYRFSE